MWILFLSISRICTNASILRIESFVNLTDTLNNNLPFESYLFFDDECKVNSIVHDIQKIRWMSHLQRDTSVEARISSLIDILSVKWPITGKLGPKEPPLVNRCSKSTRTSRPRSREFWNQFVFATESRWKQICSIFFICSPVDKHSVPDCTTYAIVIEDLRTM